MIIKYKNSNVAHENSCIKSMENWKKYKLENKRGKN